MVEIARQKCDFCPEQAIFDVKTKRGPWAYVCGSHYDSEAVKVAGLETRIAE